MDILLLVSVPGLGDRGTIHHVADAYARNFLFPKGLARIAKPADVERMAAEAERQKKRVVEMKEASRAAQQRLTNVTVRLKAQANSKGTLFAAVHGSECLKTITSQYQVPFDGAELEPKAFKELGEHQATIRWPDGASVPITVVIDHA